MDMIRDPNLTPEQRMQKRRNDPRSTDELIALALTEKDQDAAWDPVVVLQFRATLEVLSKAQALCRSSLARERELGADILGQLGVPDRAFPEECFYSLKAMLAEETEPDVLQTIAVAFGHLFDIRAVQLLAPLRNHPNEDVRLAVVHGLSRHRNDLAIQSLIELSSDNDGDVRDWATFGLGSMIETDTPRIREALFARIADTNEDAKAEALVGLARRKDERAFALILDELTSDNVGLLALEAAEELGDVRLAPALISLKEEWEGENDAPVLRLHHAILSCVPSGLA
jgi:HEAT repeat protein